MRGIRAAPDLEPDVEPDRALAVGALVALAVAVGDRALHPGAPRHPEEQAAVVVLRHREVDEALALPFQVDQETAAGLAESPRLGLRHHRLPGLVEQVVKGGPPHLAALGDKRVQGDAAPVARAGIVEVVAAVDAGEPPVDAGLVAVVARAELGEDAAAVRRDQRVQVRAEIRARVLGEQRLRGAVAEDGDRVLRGIVAQREAGGRQRAGQERGQQAAEAEPEAGKAFSGFHGNRGWVPSRPRRRTAATGAGGRSVPARGRAGWRRGPPARPDRPAG